MTADWPGRAFAIVAVIAVCGGVALMLATAWRLGDTHEWDQAIEAVVVAWRNGQPLYPPPELGWVYALPYGPVHFLYLDVLDRLAGPLGASMGGLNLFLAGLVPFAVLAAATRRHPDATIELRVASVALATLLGLFAARFHVGLQSTPVLWLLLAAALAVQIRRDGSRLGPAVVLGVIAGAIAVTKISALFYLLPISIACLARLGPARRWLAPISVAALAGVTVVALAFLPDGARLSDHIATVRSTR